MHMDHLKYNGHEIYGPNPLIKGNITVSLHCGSKHSRTELSVFICLFYFRETLITTNEYDVISYWYVILDKNITLL